MQFDHEEHSLGFILNTTTSLIKRVMSAHMKQHDLTPEQFGVLMQLRMRDGISQKKLAEVMYKDQPTVGKIIEKLESKGWVRREADPADRRAFVLRLTDEASRKQNELQALSDQMYIQAMEGVTQEEFKELIRIINKINRNLVK
ncbi:MarR family winged helix-turn-helix transcriptional regulator [Paenibacillus mucilaginosus]|uniref:MarR family transcriptional regulator n=3 Tax=Paenibacillus mucilaginosus TaxID=61624 RepID=H6NLD1_9BACL|nr:MarR family transcriptional regulator [Paenibacillus mucilaginosus]AEI41815.1 transcriptional regulator, MarR family [Paenibacillus mucilaginosus KNP414]AFC30313.1 MarR family transcriptional regulator [Paenibacillus mucilaginosus 3016]AFH62584.2 MarR family transcriptional regulator [Paenibacillus mucilaginosus K02]MCG7214496.1 MarR family transcriptional regulator [Paenibacillus mucilaginosus]WDM30778.1 MarR family transcriptional regulator [Paenibacillus mucilaginosus]